MKPIKRFVKRSLALSCTIIAFLALSGCVDYKGLDELTIVAGIAVDLNPEDEYKFDVTLEVIDTQSYQAKGSISTLTIKTSGYSVMEAISNANKQLRNKMNFATTEVLILSKQLAEKKGIDCAIEPIFRHTGTRDRMSVYISQEETAQEIFTNKDENANIVSYFIDRSVEQNDPYGSFTKPSQIYKIYNSTAFGQNSTIPAFKIAKSEDDKKTLEYDGMAILQGDRMVGSFKDSKMLYYLLLTEKCEDNDFLFFIDDVKGDGPVPISLNIRSSMPKTSFSFDGERLTIHTYVDLTSTGREMPQNILLNTKAIDGVQREANTALETKMQEMVKEMQDEQWDIFDFGLSLYRQNPKLWEELKPAWQSYFQNAKIEIECDFTIDNTGIIRQFKADKPLN